MNKVNFFWFRRDLRLHDNTALFHSLNSDYPVQCVFIFDTNILDKLEDKNDSRLAFIHHHLSSIDKQLRILGSGLITRFGDPLREWEKLSAEYNINQVFTNHDYEPYAIERDKNVTALLMLKGIRFSTFKDQVIFEKDEVIKDDGSPYTVFTAYKNKWLTRIASHRICDYSLKNRKGKFLQQTLPPILQLPQMGFNTLNIKFKRGVISGTFLNEYAEKRNIPSIQGTSRLSAHLRFGTISIRELVKKSLKEKSESWLNELIWREFYMMILWHFPRVVEHSFKKQYDRIKWRNDEQEFRAWCLGQTGYPIVDAGMRELNATGFMHNRLRMITASFLTKHLLIDWRWGESYFAVKLLDFELSSNNGGWQWVAGCGCDAAPYFRIFNPSEQTRKFDPDLIYTKKWVPEFEEVTYPKPIVEHHLARERCLRVYKTCLG